MSQPQENQSDHHVEPRRFFNHRRPMHRQMQPSATPISRRDDDADRDAGVPDPARNYRRRRAFGGKN